MAYSHTWSWGLSETVWRELVSFTSVMDLPLVKLITRCLLNKCRRTYFEVLVLVWLTPSVNVFTLNFSVVGNFVYPCYRGLFFFFDYFRLQNFILILGNKQLLKGQAVYPRRKDIRNNVSKTMNMNLFWASSWK